MNIRVLGNNPLGATHLAKVTYADLVAGGAADTTTDLVLAIFPGTTAGAVPTAGTNATDTAPAGTKIELVGMRLVTAFTASGNEGLTAAVGIDGAANTLMAATELGAYGTEILYAPGAGVALALCLANTVDVTFNTTTVNMNSYDAGEVWFFLKVDDLNQFNEQI